MKKKLILAVCIISFIVAVAATWHFIRFYDNGEARIFEIEGTEGGGMWGITPGFETHSKHFFILNPPEDLHELKAVLEEFIDQNWQEEASRRDLPVKYNWSFYRESWGFSRYWTQKFNYWGNDDIIDYHNHDIIATAIIEPLNNEIHYFVSRRSSGLKDYGETLERIHYLNGEIVSHTFIERVNGINILR